MSAHEIDNFTAAIVHTAGAEDGVRPWIRIMSMQPGQLHIYGEESIRNLRAACDAALGEPVSQHVPGEQHRVETDTHTIVLGNPPEEPDDWPEDDSRRHNCDAMGCGRAHVLARIRKPPSSPAGEGGDRAQGGDEEPGKRHEARLARQGDSEMTVYAKDQERSAQALAETLKELNNKFLIVPEDVFVTKTHQPSELEMHRADYRACKEAGWESPGELLSAYKTQEKKLAEAQAGEARAIADFDQLCENGPSLSANDFELIRMTFETRPSGSSALDAAIEAAVEPYKRDAELLRKLIGLCKETPLDPKAFGSEIAPDPRLRYDFPTLISYDAIGQKISLRDAIAAKEAEK